MIVVTVFALTLPPSPMFQRAFARAVDADDYVAFWRSLGSCHLKREERK